MRFTSPNQLFITTFFLLLLYPAFFFCQNENGNSDFTVWTDHAAEILSFEQLETQSFAQTQNHYLPSTSSAYWLRFERSNAADIPQKYLLQAGVFDSLSLVAKIADLYFTQHRGLLVAYADTDQAQFQQLSQNKFAFQLELPPHSKGIFYLRIKNLIRFESTLSDIQLLPTDHFLTPQPKRQIYFLIYHAIFLGILLFIGLFALLQFFQNRDAAYQFYAVYLFASTLYFFWKFEKSNSFFPALFTAFPDYYYYLEIPLSIAIYISYMFFILHFIDAKERVPVFYKILKIGSYSMVAYLLLDRLILALWGFSVSWEIFFVLRLFLIALSVYAIIVVIKSRHRLAGYILAGAFCMLLGGAFTSYLSKTMTSHYWGPWDIPLLPIQISTLAEVLFFSLGLGYKSRLIEREKTGILIDLQNRAAENQRIKKQKEALSQWYSNLSHEFRTPLTVILGVSQQINNAGNSFKVIQRNARQLLGLIDKMLDYSKLEEQKMELIQERADVMQQLRILAESFQLLAIKKGQHFELTCQPQQLVCLTDLEKLQQIINNLLSNALKFTPEGGLIRLSAKVSTQKDTDILHIQVYNSGTGIPKALQQKIFEPYYQLPNTSGGTGLGLALVKALTKMLKGTISLENIPGEGLAFKLQLPIQKAMDATGSSRALVVESDRKPPEAAIPMPSLQTERPTILIVEDNADVLGYLNQLLENDYSLFWASDGEHGITMAETIKPSLIISDVMMPKVDGYTLCQQLKQKTTTQAIPIILLTAKASQADRLQGLIAQADAYLVKPFDPRELKLQIQQLLQRNEKLLKKNWNVPTHRMENPTAANEETVLFMNKLNRILEENLKSEDFKVKQLCQLLNTNHVSLNQKIKKLTGQSTARYLRTFRLQRAKELLETTNLTTSEIAWEVGIPEASNFSNMFKKKYGSSPRVWRST